MIRCLQVFATLLCLGTTPAAEPAKLSQAEAERLIFQCWKEISIEHNEQKKGGGLGYCFTPKLGSCWPLSGELVGCGVEGRILIDASASPMKIDFVYIRQNKKEDVVPCIFKVEKDCLVIIEPDRTTPARKDGDYPNRPKSFEATKENKYTKKVLKRCEYLEQDD